MVMMAKLVKIFVSGEKTKFLVQSTPFEKVLQ